MYEQIGRKWYGCQPISNNRCMMTLDDLKETIFPKKKKEGRKKRKKMKSLYVQLEWKSHV